MFKWLLRIKAFLDSTACVYAKLILLPQSAVISDWYVAPVAASEVTGIVARWLTSVLLAEEKRLLRQSREIERRGGSIPGKDREAYLPRYLSKLELGDSRKEGPRTEK